MQELSYRDYAVSFGQKLKARKPLNGQIELTYRCNLNCVHCYCKGRQDTIPELTTSQWKDKLDQIYKEGCLWLTFTGGEPFLREDFPGIYAYAYQKGFLISILTNGTLLHKETFEYFKTKPPFLIEISLYGTTKEVYESVTQTPGSFQKVRNTIDSLSQIRMPLILKTVGLRQNKDQILKIKALTEELLGRQRFKFDSFIFPRLNGDTTPCQYRLSPEEIIEIENRDPEMALQRRQQLHQPTHSKKPTDSLYLCRAWLTSFFINPYGLLQFCHLTKKFSVDLTKMSFKKGFYDEFPKLLKATYRTDSKCKTCGFRTICYHCPARAYLEIRDEEAPVAYYCQLVKARQEQIKKLTLIERLKTYGTSI